MIKGAEGRQCSTVTTVIFWQIFDSVGCWLVAGESLIPAGGALSPKKEEKGKEGEKEGKERKEGEERRRGEGFN